MELFNFRNRLTPFFIIIHFTTTLYWLTVVEVQMLKANFYYLLLLRGQDQQAAARFRFKLGTERQHRLGGYRTCREAKKFFSRAWS